LNTGKRKSGEKVIRKIHVTAAIIAAISLSLGSATSQEVKKGSDPVAKVDDPAWGKPKKGLKFGVFQTGANGINAPRVTFAFDNTGTEDYLLLLGDSYGMGRKHWLQNVRLRLTDADGRVRVLLPNRPELVDQDGALITTLATQLTTGGRYSISHALNDFYDENDAKATLPAGRYRATAEFAGTAAPKPMKKGEVVAEPHLVYMHFWEGTVKSGECEITVPAKPAK
jgi:hypothetical protein